MERTFSVRCSPGWTTSGSTSFRQVAGSAAICWSALASFGFSLNNLRKHRTAAKQGVVWNESPLKTLRWGPSEVGFKHKWHKTEPPSSDSSCEEEAGSSAGPTFELLRAVVAGVAERGRLVIALRFITGWGWRPWQSSSETMMSESLIAIPAQLRKCGQPVALCSPKRLRTSMCDADC